MLGDLLVVLVVLDLVLLVVLLVVVVFEFLFLHVTALHKCYPTRSLDDC